MAARAGLQRRLWILAGEFEKGALSYDPGRVLKSGATVVRQWRGYTHTLLVREHGFEYDGQCYRERTCVGHGTPSDLVVDYNNHA
jgi:Protein of unknown function (DUF2924)